MAHTLSLVYGSTTLALASGSYSIVEYPMATPGEGDITVTETAKIQVSGSTLSALQTNIKAIERAALQVKWLNAGQTVFPLFVHFQGDGDSLAWRSRIHAIALTMPDTLLGADWANKQVEVGISWTRSPFWEAVSWIALPLTNPNGTDDTSGLAVYSYNDGEADSTRYMHNYVDVDGVNDVLGNLPAPVKLQMTPSDSVYFVYAGSQADISGLGLVQPYIEFTEDSSGFTGSGGTPTAAAGASDNEYVTFDLAAGASAQLYYNLDMSSYQGALHKAILVLFGELSPTHQVYGRISIGPADDTPIISSGWSKLSIYEINMLGDLQVPPRSYLPRSGTIGDTYLIVDLKNYGSSTETVKPDYLLLMPTMSYLVLGSTVSDVASGERLIYTNDLEPFIYEETTAGADPKNNFDRIEGNGIFVVPGVNNRIHFQLASVGLIITHNIYATVKAWYKPRRTTI